MLMKFKNIVYIVLIMSCVFSTSCKQKNKAQLFTLLTSNETGIKFSNDIDETKMPGDAGFNLQ